jgi:hypothetical protein
MAFKKKENGTISDSNGAYDSSWEMPAALLPNEGANMIAHAAVCLDTRSVMPVSSQIQTVGVCSPAGH